MIKNNLKRHRVGELTLRFKMGNILFLTTTTHPKIFVPCESWTDHACKRLEDVSWSPCWVFIGPGPFWLLRVVCHRRELVRGGGGREGGQSQRSISTNAGFEPAASSSPILIPRPAESLELRFFFIRVSK